MTFRVGQKVVCIKEGPWLCQDPCVSYPRRFGVYTIRAIDHHSDGPGLRLVEIVNRDFTIERDTIYLGECTFCASRFRPIVDKKTDIGFAHEILRKASRTKETVT